MAGREPEERVCGPVARLEWRVTSLHWRYDPAFIRTLVPPGLEVDTWEGDAWVSLMRNLVEGLAWGGPGWALGSPCPRYTHPRVEKACFPL